jgi:hypothetical protein
MTTRKQIILLAVLLAAGVAGYFGWAAWRADRNLVTLDVRNVDVHDVIAKLQRQTWENIYADKNVQGKVTLRVRGVPLDEVLRMIGDQTFSRPMVLFAVYSSGGSLSKLEQSVRGEADPEKNGWTNLASAVRGGPMGGPGPMMIGAGPGGNPFGAMADNSDQPVSFEIRAKELSFATLAFQRFAQARVVVEDGANDLVTLILNKVPVGKAVTQLAGQVKRQSKKIFVLQGMRGPGGPGGPGDGPRMVRMEGGNMIAQRGPGGDRPPEMSDAQRDEMRQKREALEQELKQALPAEERQKLDQQETERRKLMEEMANLPPEERRARMEQMMRANGGPNMSQMMKQRVLNTTPEQRAEMIRRQREMRQNGGFGSGGPGPGNPPAR